MCVNVDELRGSNHQITLLSLEKKTCVEIKILQDNTEFLAATKTINLNKIFKNNVYYVESQLVSHCSVWGLVPQSWGALYWLLWFAETVSGSCR